jgi:hypothetical protein
MKDFSGSSYSFGLNGVSLLVFATASSILLQTSSTLLESLMLISR